MPDSYRSLAGSSRTTIAGIFVLAVCAAVRTDNAEAGETPGKSRKDTIAVARRVDALFEKSWAENKITPSTAAEDAVFLRRLWLDIAGKIPPVSVTREFLAGERENLHDQMTDRLLSGPTYVTNFADFWQAALIPEASADPRLRQLRPSFEAWLRDQLRKDVPYDRFVHSLLTTEIRTPEGGNIRGREPAPEVFFRVKQLKPENLAGATSRAFLGVRLECAQCHNHPFDVWKQEQFWSFAAFFSGVSAENGFAPVVEKPRSSKIVIPDTEKTVQAAFLTNEQPDWKVDGSAREKLAEWITADDNPWFARMAVNRLWGHFFGRGFVEPVDDFGETNLPSHPEVLNLLAEEFAVHEFDVKFIIRVITSTRAYRLSSRQTHDSQAAPEQFARLGVRGLTPRQIFNSLSVALGTFEPFTVPGQFNDRPAEQEFLDTFNNEADSPLERPTTILQSLVMMNGNLIGQGTGIEDSRTLRAVVDYPLMSTPQKIETLFLSAVSRKPTKTQLDKLVDYVEQSNPHNDSSKALADVYWSLLNSSEFLFNH